MQRGRRGALRMLVTYIVIVLLFVAIVLFYAWETR